MSCGEALAWNMGVSVLIAALTQIPRQKDPRRAKKLVFIQGIGNRCLFAIVDISA